MKQGRVCEKVRELVPGLKPILELLESNLFTPLMCCEELPFEEIRVPDQGISMLTMLQNSLKTSGDYGDENEEIDWSD